MQAEAAKTRLQADIFRRKSIEKEISELEKKKEKVARIQRHTACQRKDFQHKKSFSLAEQYDLVCIEDLDMQAMSKALNFGKSVMDNGYITVK